MGWFTNTFSTTIGKKVLMSITGIFIILFLIVHLAGNLQLLIQDGGKSFNQYSHFMGNNGLIQTVSRINFALIFLHILYSVILTRKNKGARELNYDVNISSKNTSWASRNMGILGALILVFLVIHLRKFWYVFKFGEVPTVTYGDTTMPNYFMVVNEAYTHWYYVLFYVISMGIIGFHLIHGFQSAFQTLGINHKKYTPIIKNIGLGYSIVIPLGFAIIPVIMFLRNLN